MKEKIPIGSHWQYENDSRIFVVIEKQPFGQLVIKQIDKAYFGFPRQKDLLKNAHRIDS